MYKPPKNNNNNPNITSFSNDFSLLATLPEHQNNALSV